jgi:hypothetical protein
MEMGVQPAESRFARCTTSTTSLRVRRSARNRPDQRLLPPKAQHLRTRCLPVPQVRGSARRLGRPGRYRSRQLWDRRPRRLGIGGQNVLGIVYGPHRRVLLRPSDYGVPEDRRALHRWARRRSSSEYSVVKDPFVAMLSPATRRPAGGGSAPAYLRALLPKVNGISLSCSRRIRHPSGAPSCGLPSVRACCGVLPAGGLHPHADGLVKSFGIEGICKSQVSRSVTRSTRRLRIRAELRARMSSRSSIVPSVPRGQT